MNRFAIRCAAGLSVPFLLVACSSAPSSGGGSSSPGQVTLTVGDRPSSSDPANRASFDKKVADFQQANPDIKLNPVETIWDATTFQAQAAGGQLPDVLNVPFTEPQGLIARKQVADLTKVLKDDGLLDELNPNVLKIGQDQSGNVYAVPTAAYSVGLVYNRELFTKAGLDPDKPPATWDELRADAKQIAQKTGQAGYAQMTTNNTGGWMFTTQTYAFGGSIENEDGSKATFDDAPSKAALQLLHDMKWTDKSMGQAVLYDIDGISKAFAAGKIGMFINGSDIYTFLVQAANLDPKIYGIAPLPLAKQKNAGVMGGGSIAVVRPDTKGAKLNAALQWIDFFYMEKLIKKPAALRDARILVANQQPVGVPAFPIFNKVQYDRANSWIKSYINVPIKQMNPFLKGIFKQNLYPEPAASTQSVYHALDPVVQAVFADKNANVSALLAQANDVAQKAIREGK